MSRLGNSRRGFLTSLFKGLVVASVAPQIVTHGLKLKNGIYQRDQLLIEIEAYNKLPYYLAKMQAYTLGNLQMYDKLYNMLEWAPNLGKTNAPSHPSAD